MALRNEQFFSLAELNAAIRKKLDAFNAKLFQKKEGSRRGLFLGEELSLLTPLPATRFELCDWKVATVQFNYHIAVDKIYYSVPYQHIREKADVRITDTMVEIFIKHNRIASHRRLYGRPGQYSTVTEHMSEDHQKYLEWNGDRFRKWAAQIGINTNEVVNNILISGRVEQTDACIAGIDYTSGRKLNKELIGRLATCEYIAEYRNIFITGATGSGKTYMATNCWMQYN